jgi:hypothetical protein
VSAPFQAPTSEMQSMIHRPPVHRPAAPRCRGGASSLLRLSSPATSRWPSATSFADWADRLSVAGEVAAAPMVAPAPEAASEWFTRLWPSTA